MHKGIRTISLLFVKQSARRRRKSARKRNRAESRGDRPLPRRTRRGTGARASVRRVREGNAPRLYYACTSVCLSLFGRVFVSVCIAVPSAKRRVQEHAEVHEHVLHGDVHRRVHTEDRRFRREGKLHHANEPQPLIEPTYRENVLL